MVFDDLNLNITAGSFVTILGKNGSGKTVLANILTGNLRYKGEILIFNKPFYNDDICLVNEDFEDDDTVMNILLKRTNGLNREEISKKIFNLSVEFCFSKYLNQSFNNLSITEKKLVILASNLLNPRKILIMDNFFEGLSKGLKKDVLNKLRRFSKKNNITVINFTNDAEDYLLSNYIIIIGMGKVLLSGSKRKVLENESFFEENNLGLPFVVSLSDKLKFYDLIDDIYLNEKKLVDDLWK